MRGDARDAGRGRLRSGVKEDGGVPILRRRPGSFGDRGKPAVGPDQEEHLGGGRQRIAAWPGRDPRPVLVPPDNGGPGQLRAEQSRTARVGRDDPVAGQPGPQPVDRAIDVVPQNRRGKRVEVVLVGEQENHRGSLEQAAVDRGREEFTRGQFEPRLPDLAALRFGSGPHEHLQPR
jgi:hypothetical protein